MISCLVVRDEKAVDLRYGGDPVLGHEEGSESGISTQILRLEDARTIVGCLTRGNLKIV